MKEKGIKKSEVFRLADESNRSGKDPSARAIRARLGSGSLSTISKYLKLWEAEKAARLEKDLDGKNIFHGIPGKIIADFLSNEHPQVIALVLSHLEPKFAAEILEGHPDDFKKNVLTRMETLAPVENRVARKILEILILEVSALRNNCALKRGGKKFVSQVRKEMEQA